MPNKEQLKVKKVELISQIDKLRLEIVELKTKREVVWGQFAPTYNIGDILFSCGGYTEHYQPNAETIVRIAFNFYGTGQASVYGYYTKYREIRTPYYKTIEEAQDYCNKKNTQGARENNERRERKRDDLKRALLEMENEDLNRAIS